MSTSSKAWPILRAGLQIGLTISGMVTVGIVVFLYRELIAPYPR